jgi:hypothetical protein
MLTQSAANEAPPVRQQFEPSDRTKAVNAFIDEVLLVSVNAQLDDAAYDLRNALNDVIVR